MRLHAGHAIIVLATIFMCTGPSTAVRVTQAARKNGESSSCSLQLSSSLWRRCPLRLLAGSFLSASLSLLRSSRHPHPRFTVLDLPSLLPPSLATTFFLLLRFLLLLLTRLTSLLFFHGPASRPRGFSRGSRVKCSATPLWIKDSDTRWCARDVTGARAFSHGPFSAPSGTSPINVRVNVKAGCCRRGIGFPRCLVCHATGVYHFPRNQVSFASSQCVFLAPCQPVDPSEDRVQRREWWSRGESKQERR